MNYDKKLGNYKIIWCLENIVLDSLYAEIRGYHLRTWALILER